MREAWDRYDDTGESTIRDLVNEIEYLISNGEAPLSLQAAVDAFREAEQEDQVLAGRGENGCRGRSFLYGITER
jgi:hypothetical protein